MMTLAGQLMGAQYEEPSVHRLGTAVVFAALYYKTFMGVQAKPAHPQKSPGREPLKAGYSAKEDTTSAWDMESPGTADSIPAHRRG